MPQSDPFKVEVEMTCDGCSKVHRVQVEAAMKLGIGDAPYTDPRNPEFGRCKKCQKRLLKVTKVPDFVQPVKLQGFWKPPTGGGSSGSETES